MFLKSTKRRNGTTDHLILKGCNCYNDDMISKNKRIKINKQVRWGKKNMRVTGRQKCTPFENMQASSYQ